MSGCSLRCSHGVTRAVHGTISCILANVESVDGRHSGILLLVVTTTTATVVAATHIIAAMVAVATSITAAAVDTAIAIVAVAASSHPVITTAIATIVATMHGGGHRCSCCNPLITPPTCSGRDTNWVKRAD